MLWSGLVWTLGTAWSLLTGLVVGAVHLAETFSRLYPWALTAAFGITVIFVLPILIYTSQDSDGGQDSSKDGKGRKITWLRQTAGDRDVNWVRLQGSKTETARDAVTGRAIGSTYTVKDEQRGREGEAGGVFERGAAGIDAPDWHPLKVRTSGVAYGGITGVTYHEKPWSAAGRATTTYGSSRYPT